MALSLFVISPAKTQADDEVTVVAFGDSLTAGYGLHPQDVFPLRLEQALREKDIAARVINAGVSGDTTAGGLARLDWSLSSEPAVMIVQLGGNDALRGVEPAIPRMNLDAIIRRIHDAGVTVVLAGMYAPPNLGDDYVREFNAIFPELAKEHGIRLYPFFLEGVAAKPEYNQGDGLHPNRRGVQLIVNRFAPFLVEAIRTRY